MHTWDIGGQQRIRALWRHYFSGTDALIFVIDSADTERIKDAKAELQNVMSDKELKKCLVAVVANKQDLSDAKDPKEIKELLELDSLNHKWCIIPAVATDGKGLVETLSWISNNHVE